MTLYEQLLAAGVPLDHHESDLYVKSTPESRAILGTYAHRGNVTRFTSALDGAAWFDVPFAYDPFWKEKR